MKSSTSLYAYLICGILYDRFKKAGNFKRHRCLHNRGPRQPETIWGKRYTKIKRTDVAAASLPTQYVVVLPAHSLLFYSFSLFFLLLCTCDIYTILHVHTYITSDLIRIYIHVRCPNSSYYTMRTITPSNRFLF